MMMNVDLTPPRPELPPCDTLEYDCENPIHWRLPPEESYSDWTLEVVKKGNSAASSSSKKLTQPSSSSSSSCHSILLTPRENRSSVVYHVHRWVLASGPRCSEYFRKLFDDEDIPGGLGKSHSTRHKLLKKPNANMNDVNNTNRFIRCDDGSLQTMFSDFMEGLQGLCSASATTLLVPWCTGRSHEDDDLAFRLIRSSRTTRMILPDRVAAVVPIVLDYLYARDDQQLKQALLPLTRDTATAVHYLASRLEMRRLGWEASQFWENDLALANCHVYYQHAKTCDNFYPVLDAVARVCETHFLAILPESPLIVFCSSEPTFWLHILKGLPKTKQISLHACRLVTEICILNKERVDASLFDALTDAKFLPTIDFESAKDLLILHEYYQAKKGELCDEPTVSGTTNLQLRCVNAIAEQWMEQPTAFETTELADYLKEQHPVLWTLLNRLVRYTQAQAEENEQTINSLSRQLEETFSATSELEEQNMRLMNSSPVTLSSSTSSLYQSSPESTASAHKMGTSLKKSSGHQRPYHQQSGKPKQKSLRVLQSTGADGKRPKSKEGFYHYSPDSKESESEQSTPTKSPYQVNKYSSFRGTGLGSHVDNPDDDVYRMSPTSVGTLDTSLYRSSPESRGVASESSGSPSTTISDGNPVHLNRSQYISMQPSPQGKENVNPTLLAPIDPSAHSSGSKSRHNAAKAQKKPSGNQARPQQSLLAHSTVVTVGSRHLKISDAVQDNLGASKNAKLSSKLRGHEKYRRVAAKANAHSAYHHKQQKLYFNAN